MNAKVDSPTPAPENGCDCRWRILLATESLVDQKLAAGLLRMSGHEVLVAADGGDAARECDLGEVDAVIVDWLLPEISRLELTRAIRQRERLSGRRVAILAMTDEVDGIREECQEFGIDGLLGKPLRVEQVANYVAHALSDSHRTKEARPVAAREPDQVDWHVALEAVGGRRDLLKELIEIFFAEYPPTLEAIRDAIENRDAKGLQVSAHKLKGCLRYFGHTHASDRAKELEDMGRSGQFDGALTRLEDLDVAVTRLLPNLRTAASEE